MKEDLPVKIRSKRSIMTQQTSLIYLYKYSDSSKPIIKYYADEDTFFQGNEFFSISQNDDLKIGDKVTVSHYGISKEYYNYINILVSISGNGGGPFNLLLLLLEEI
jgi:hypothetical protein